MKNSKKIFWSTVGLAMLFLVLIGETSAQTDQTSDQKVLIVQGAAGESKYEKLFNEWTGRLKKTVNDANIPLVTVGVESDSTPDLDKIKTFISGLKDDKSRELWIVFIGHGTFDGSFAKFNLKGPDISAKELGELLGTIDKRIVLVNCASSSGLFINRLSASDRIIVTATKSGYQYNFARFADYFTSAIADPAFDLDKDGQTSVLEAFLASSSQVAEFYESDKRIATEQALLDDNADKLGTPADWFKGIRATKSAKSGAKLDGLLANQTFLVRGAGEVQMSAENRKLRDGLEAKIEQLRPQRNTLGEAAYLDQIEPIMVQLAKLYESTADEPTTKKN